MQDNEEIVDKGGRPTKYKPAFAKQAYKLCLLGCTDQEIADILEVTVSTIYEWKKEHKRFSEAVKKGKTLADANVAERLYQRAIGFEHDSEEIRVTSEGTGMGSVVTRVPVRKVYPPDVAAALNWLANRQRAKWRRELDLGKLTEDQLSQLFNQLTQSLK